MSPLVAGSVGFVIVLTLFVEVQDWLHEDRDGPLWRAIWTEWTTR